MRHPALYLALAACLALGGSVADAAPRKAKHRVKVAPPIDEAAIEIYEEDDEADEDIEADAPLSGTTQRAEQARRKTARAAVRERDEDEDEDEAPTKAERRKKARAERVAFDSRDDGEDEDSAEEIRAPLKLRKGITKKRTKDWHVVIGPYLWASSVDANVSLGPSSVGAGVDFFTLERHAKYGAEVLAEVHYGRFSLFTDFMYGVIAINGDKAVGPLMVSLNGTASSLLVDAAAGYRLAGDEQSVLSVEARAGVRYQRTAIAGAVSVGDSDLASSSQVDSGKDAVAGARVFVRPFHRFFVSSTVDIGVVGDSSITWSASADASLRITSRVLFSLGYRRLTIDRANVSMVMHGPRAALQLVF